MSKKKNNPAQMDLFAMTENVENVKAAQEAAPVLDVPDGAKIDPEPSDAVKQIVETVEKSEPEETAKPEPEKKAVKAKRAKAAKVKDAKPDTLEDHPEPDDPTPGAWEPENWKRLTDCNDHTTAQMKIAEWAWENATEEREEFAGLVDDYKFVKAEQDREGGLSESLYNMRYCLYMELKGRIKNEYGEAKWAECAACL